MDVNPAPRGLKFLGACVVLAGGFLLGWAVSRQALSPPGRVAPVAGPASPACVALRPDVLARLKAATVFIQVRSRSYLDENEEEEPTPHPTLPSGTFRSPKGRGEYEESSGSGFLLSPDGRVATNWHVVAARQELGELTIPLRPDRIEVILHSGTPRQILRPARLIAADPQADLAILKMELDEAPAVEKAGSVGQPSVPVQPGPVAWLELGRSEELMESTPLWVLGFPLGKVFSVLQRGPELSLSHGCVSSLRHDDRGRLERIQFDAAVTPGNSGGPVVLADGRVVGLANIALGASRVNFAVPAADLAHLLQECPADRRVTGACRVEVTSDPPGAEVFFDAKPAGRTPLATPVPGGYALVQLTAPGRRAWVKDLSIYAGRKIHATLPPLETTSLQIAPPAAAAPAAAPYRHDRTLFKQDFSVPRDAESWRQDTGGGQTRTWYVEDGALHQFSDDGLLHAVFAGDEQWTDYAFAARVRIQSNDKDGRAGLIFRATQDGFALFRLHRATSKVQFAYHANDPFGWQVLAERPAPSLAGDTWYEMEVQAAGRHVLCLLDKQVVLEGILPLAPCGGVGFYSVDSRASFDDAVVATVQQGVRAKEGDAPPKEYWPPAGGGLRPTLQSFWFSEPFTQHSVFWQAFAGDKPAAPWLALSGACLRDAGPPARDLLVRYDIHDAQVRAVVSCAKGTVGLVLREDLRARYVFAVTPDEGRLRLILEDDSKQEIKVLQEKEDPQLRDAPFFPLGEPKAEENGPPRSGPRPGHARLLVLSADMQGTRLRCGVNGPPSLDVNDASLSHGKVGFYTDRAKAMFLSLQASGPAEP